MSTATLNGSATRTTRKSTIINDAPVNHGHDLRDFSLIAPKPSPVVKPTRTPSKARLRLTAAHIWTLVALAAAMFTLGGYCAMIAIRAAEEAHEQKVMRYERDGLYTLVRYHNIPAAEINMIEDHAESRARNDQ